MTPTRDELLAALEVWRDRWERERDRAETLAALAELQSDSLIVLLRFASFILALVDFNGDDEAAAAIRRAAREWLDHADDDGTERLVTVDGQVGATLGRSETLMVRRAQRSVILVRFPEMTFFTRMRRKLGWGAPPDDPRA